MGVIHENVRIENQDADASGISYLKSGESYGENM